MSTLTLEEQTRIADYLAIHTLPKGLGTEESACSIASINLALTGTLTDVIPFCMSPVIGKWIIGVQDAMPYAMRNSAEWKRLLPLAAGTGRQAEKERLAIIMNWMWCEVLPSLQTVADKGGFGVAWLTMCREKTAEAARDAAADAAAAADAYAYDAYTAARDAAAAARADAAAYAAYATDAAVYAAYAAYAAHIADYAKAWEKFNPCGLLQKLIEVTA